MLFLTYSLILGKFCHDWAPYDAFGVCYTSPHLPHPSSQMHLVKTLMSTKPLLHDQCGRWKSAKEINVYIKPHWFRETRTLLKGFIHFKLGPLTVLWVENTQFWLICWPRVWVCNLHSPLHTKNITFCSQRRRKWWSKDGVSGRRERGREGGGRKREFSYTVQYFQKKT